jgi:hypothetical protein
VWLKANENDMAVPRRWEEISKLFEHGKERIPQPSQPWVYGPLGVQNEDMYDWERLLPYKWEDPSNWNQRFIFEICVFLTGSARSLVGNHSWLRLRTPAGEVYSVGLYRTGKHGSHPYWNKPFRVMSGELMSPDVSEFWPGEVRSLQIAITRKAFVKVREDIEREKKKGTQAFENFDPNCTRWVVEKAKIAGISLNGSENLVSLFLPRKIDHIAQSVWQYVPAKKVVSSVGSVFVAFWVNSLQFVLGAGSVDPSLEEKVKVRPRICSLKDLLNPQNMIVYHPYTLADKTMIEINAWRAKERERILKENLPDQDTLLRDIAYAVPEDQQ